MTTETKAHACPHCGDATGIFARVSLKWTGDGWAICPEIDEIDCMECEAVWTQSQSPLPDPRAGLAYLPATAATRELIEAAHHALTGDIFTDAEECGAAVANARAVAARLHRVLSGQGGEEPTDEPDIATGDALAAIGGEG